MSTQTPSKPQVGRFAICIDNAAYPASLELHKVYQILPDPGAERDGDLRVIDESGEDYLFPKNYFVMLDLPAQVAQTFRTPSTLTPQVAG